MIRLLLSHLFESTVLCLLFGWMALCLGRRGAAVRHAIWFIGVAKFAIPTALLAATGAWVAAVLPATDWIAAAARRLLTAFTSLFAAWTLPIHVSEGSAGSFLLLAVWMFGAAVAFGIWLYRLRMSYRDLPRATGETNDALKRAKARFGFRGPIELRVTDRTGEPALVGIFRPVIAIPQGLPEALTDAEFEAVLLHEIAHAYRRDNLIGVFVHCLVCVFWFHPLLWVVERRLTAERERACDEMVLERGAIPQVYIGGLAKVCRFQLFADVAGVSAASGSHLKTRFDQIAAYRVRRASPYVLRFAVAVFVLLGAILPMAGGYCEQCASSGQDMTGERNYQP